MPQGVRDDMLAHHGVWALVVPKEQRLRALGAIRGELGMSIADVSARRSQAGPLASGTFVEMTRLRLLLGEGLDGEVCRLNGTS